MKIGGNTLYLTKKYIIDTYGHDKFNELLKLMDEKSAKVMSEPIISTNMYDIGIDLKLNKAFESLFGRDEHKALGEYKVKKQISGLYGLIIKFVSVETIVSRSQEMWNKIYSDGKLTFKYEKNVRFVCTISEIEFADQEYYMFTILCYLKSFIEVIVGKTVSASMKNIDKTTTEMIFTIKKDL